MKKLSDEQIKAELDIISNSKLAIYSDKQLIYWNDRAGIKLDPEYAKQRAVKIKRSISQYNLLGEWIRNWDSRIEACNELGIQSAHLNKCLKGTLPQAGGFVWTYNTGKKNISDEIEKRKQIYRKGKNKQKAISQYNLAGEWIRDWESAMEAAKGLGKNTASGINQCCRGEVKTQYGFIWKFK